MSKQAVVHSSRLRYSHPSLGLPPCFNRLHEPRSSCIHTSGCPCLPWHCQPHLVGVRYGGYPNYLSRSSQTQLARYRFPSTSPLRHSRYRSSHRLGRVCRLPLSPVRYNRHSTEIGLYGRNLLPHLLANLLCLWYRIIINVLKLLWEHREYSLTSLSAIIVSNIYKEADSMPELKSSLIK